MDPSLQVDERELLSSKFASEVESLQATQRREFRDWVSLMNLQGYRATLHWHWQVMTVHAEYKTSNQLPAPVPRSESNFSLSSQVTAFAACIAYVNDLHHGYTSTHVSLLSFQIQNLQPEVLSLQESFTITLGAQMKAMHNLR